MVEKINAWEDCVSWEERPKTLQEGLRILADWFDAVYQDADKNDAVQQDLRKWATEVDALLAVARALVEAAKKLLDKYCEEVEIEKDFSGDGCKCYACEVSRAIAAVEAIISPPHSSPPPADNGRA